jgi:hypothetical protein
MNYRVKPTTLANVLRYSACMSRLVDEHAPHTLPGPPEEAAPTTAAEMLSQESRQKDVKQAATALVARAQAILDALVLEGRAVEVVALIVEREDGQAMGAAEAGEVPASVFVEAWEVFSGEFARLTSGVLGLRAGSAYRGPQGASAPSLN